MSSSSDANFAALWNNAGILTTRYLGICIFFFGIIGNIINILVLSQKTLRSNPCAWCFLMSSIASIIAYSSGLSTRILSTWNLDLSNTNRGICKLRGIFVYTSLTATFWLIALATIDRWLSSSTIALRRQKSTLKNAQRGTVMIVCLSIGIYVQMLVCYEANLINTPLPCYSKSTACRLLGDLSFAFITIVCPLLVMVVFGLMTISNIRQAVHRVRPTNTGTTNDPGNGTRSATTTGQQRQRKKTDRQLLIMLFFQVILLTTLAFPLSIDRLYLTLTVNVPKTTLQAAFGNFIFDLLLLFLYLSNGISFYIYTLSGGSIFRKGLLNVVQMFRGIILHQ
jgi:hypothetical protein